MRKLRKWLGICAEVLLMAAVVWAAAHASLVVYGIGQARGQLHIVWNARPLPDVLADPEVADSVKQRLVLVEEIKRYGIDSLGLAPSGSYSTYFDQGGRPVLWVLTASEPWMLNAVEWEFPVIGSVSYKGFFDYRKGLAEEARMKGRGFDTEYGDVAAWSTLGFFSDPILSGMLRREEGSLAELILHEMTHGTLYLPGSVDFNENLASLIGEEGARRFLSFRYGPGSEERRRYEQRKEDYEIYSRFMIASAGRLDSLYRILPADTAARRRLKSALMADIVARSRDLTFSAPQRGRGLFSQGIPNNAHFLAFRRYDAKKDSLRNVLNESYGGDIRRYLVSLEKMSR